MADIYDIVIIGGGPAGLAAGLYASRARMKTVLFESLSIMGQALTTDMVENYPGIEKIGGLDLIDRMKKQAVSFGLVVKNDTISGVYKDEKESSDLWKVEGESGTVNTFSVIVASGACSKRLNVPGEAELCGRGVSYCATCDGAFFKDKEVIVVGGGDTAVEEALFLTKFVRKAAIVHRRDRLRAAKVLQERAFSSEKISFLWNSVVERIDGNGKVESVTVKDVVTGENKRVSCDGVFIFTGWEPNTCFLKGVVDMNDKGSIIAARDMSTSRKGVFACGDCCERPLHQIVTACGDGAIAADSARKYVEELKGVAYE